MALVRDILVGPVRTTWRNALLATAPSHAALRFASTRRDFLRLLRLRLDDIVVVTAADPGGIPTLPLLPMPTPSAAPRSIILLHDSAVVQLPSSWSTDTASIHHILRGDRSHVDVTRAMWQFVSRLQASGNDAGIAHSL